MSLTQQFFDVREQEIEYRKIHGEIELEKFLDELHIHISTLLGAGLLTTPEIHTTADIFNYHLTEAGM